MPSLFPYSWSQGVLVNKYKGQGRHKTIVFLGRSSSIRHLFQTGVLVLNKILKKIYLNPSEIAVLLMMCASGSQMKELGLIVYNCSCLVIDLQRTFALYSSLKYKNKVPPTWSKRLYGVYHTQNKLSLNLNETKAEAFISVSSLLTLIQDTREYYLSGFEAIMVNRLN